MGQINTFLKGKINIYLMLGILIGIFGFFTSPKFILLGIFGVLGFKFSLDKFHFLIMGFCLTLPVISDYGVLFFIGYIFLVFTIKFISRDEIKINSGNLYKYVILIFIIMILNTVFSINPSGSMRDLIIHFTGIILVLIIANSQIKKEQLNSVFNSLIIIAFFISIFGIYQYFAEVPMGSGWVDSTQNPDLKTRVFGTFENPNLFAEYLIMIFPILFGQVIYSKGILKKAVFSFLGLTMFIALIMTSSRAGWLGFVFGAFIFIVVLNFKIIFPLAILGGMSIPFMPASILHRISTIGSLNDSSNYYRYSLWKNSIDIVKDFWQSGIGLGYMAFRSITPYYIKNMAPYHTHNTYLQILVEFGALGLILFMIFCFQVFKTGILSFKKSKDRYIRILSVSMVASFSSIMLHGIAENIFFNPKIIIMFWLIIGFTIKLNLMASLDE